MRIRIFYAVSLLMFPTAMFILFKLRNAFYGVFVDKYKDVSILVIRIRETYDTRTQACIWAFMRTFL